MAGGRITPAQLKRLQTLYGQLATHTQLDTGREARLAWASHLVGREVQSFSDLDRGEAIYLLDALSRNPTSKRMDRDAAARYAKDGRHDGQQFDHAPRLVSAREIAAIEEMYLRLGWDRDRFDAWLRSGRSPVKKSDPLIRTSRDANRVRWALKGMLKRQGLWQEERKTA